MTDDVWQALLTLKKTGSDAEFDTSPASAVYGAIAKATGPFVLAQVGQSLDGRVATPAGDARDVSGPDGLAHLHRCRALVDAVIVGEHTVSADNPRLSVRIVNGSDPIRVAIDCHARLKGDEGLFHDGGAPVIVFQSTHANLQDYPNARVIRLQPTDTGLAPAEILAELSNLGLKKILVEGGAKTIARFINAGMVDRLHVAISSLIIGSGPTGINLPAIETLSEAHRPTTRVYSLGSDILFDCELKNCRQSLG
ncbi:RibD family protein [uncultured Cohaesibacter sp.]|uniref:RibD family protein n=1 Tax=uncultured Cohaesibacter sp. TaxID=1002546 RepID=UPI0029C839D0|nr:RibD family protein [uncultured Cohaesibacter sp.]